MTSIREIQVPVKPSVEKSNRYGVRAPKGGCTVNGREFKGGMFCYPYDVANPHGVKVAEVPAVVEAPKPVKIAIHGFNYEVSELEIDPSIGSVAFRMHKVATNNTYHAHLDVFGEAHCDCPDHTMRRAGTGDCCKHIKALQAKGYLPGPAKQEREFDATALLAWAHARGIVETVGRIGKHLGFGSYIKRFTNEQAVEVYYEASRVAAEVASGI